MPEVYDDILEVLGKVSPLSKESLVALTPYFSHQKLDKDDYILRNGEICKHIYFIQKGFARIFYFKNGKEITEWFAPEKTFCFSITSYFESVPSRLVIQCLESCEVIRLSKAGLDALSSKNLEIAHLLMTMFSRSLILSQKRMDSIQFETARQRYHKLLEEQPHILQKVPLQYIASFLGITSETLSRIRTGI